MRWALAAVGICSALAAAGCAGPTQASIVRGRAAYDFGCARADTRIVDAEVGVYRIEGCGFAATYQCDDEQLFSAPCRQLFANKLDDGGPTKPVAGSSLAKTR